MNYFVVAPVVSFYRGWVCKVILPVYDLELDREFVVSVLYHDSDFIIVNKPFDMNIDSGTVDPTRPLMHFSAKSEAQVFGADVRSIKRPDCMSTVKAYFPQYYLRNAHQLDYASKFP
jgi:hypothetical protein